MDERIRIEYQKWLAYYLDMGYPAKLAQSLASGSTIYHITEENKRMSAN